MPFAAVMGANLARTLSIASKSPTSASRSVRDNSTMCSAGESSAPARTVRVSTTTGSVISARVDDASTSLNDQSKSSSTPDAIVLARRAAARSSSARCVCTAEASAAAVVASTPWSRHHATVCDRPGEREGGRETEQGPIWQHSRRATALRQPLASDARRTPKEVGRALAGRQEEAGGSTRQELTSGSVMPLAIASCSALDAATSRVPKYGAPARVANWVDTSASDPHTRAATAARNCGSRQPAPNQFRGTGQKLARGTRGRAPQPFVRLTRSDNCHAAPGPCAGCMQAAGGGPETRAAKTQQPGPHRRESVRVAVHGTNSSQAGEGLPRRGHRVLGEAATECAQPGATIDRRRQSKHIVVVVVFPLAVRWGRSWRARDDGLTV